MKQSSDLANSQM